MNTNFYDYKRQLLRELHTRWRLRGRGSTVLGTVLVLAGFYVLHSPGYSQVYEVFLPYFVAAVYLSVIIMTQTYVERIQPTAAYFTNLPRDRRVTMDANALYFLGHAVYFQLVIGLGIYFKLGGADITPYYRLHPDVMTLPVAAAIFTLWIYSRQRYWDTAIRLAATGIVVGVVLIIRQILIGTGGPEDNFIPDRWVPLGFGVVLAAAILLDCGALLLHMRRRRWTNGKV